jgi:hypothetical protein
MRRDPVQSEAISSIGYAPASHLLEVEFATGRLYQYFGVPESDIEDMRRAPSLGTWFNTIFKPKGYPYREIH